MRTIEMQIQTLRNKPEKVFRKRNKESQRQTDKERRRENE